MKKRVSALILALCLCLALLPGAALAEEPQYQDPPKVVTTAAELAAALPSGMHDPIPVAELGADITVDAAHSVYAMGRLIVPEAYSLTIAGGATVQANVVNQGIVRVCSGGSLATTMGGDIENRGSIMVEPGGVLVSQMGGKVRNLGESAVLELDGTFRCGSVNYDSADHLWFENSGAVFGGGDLVVYDAGAGDAERDSVDLDDMIEAVMDALGQTQRYGDGHWDDVNILREVEVDRYEDFATTFQTERTVKGETVEGNMDTIIVLADDVTVPPEADLGGMIKVVVSSGVALTVEGTLKAGVVIEGAGKGWDEEKEEEIDIGPAAVIVKSSGALATTMGGDIENFGALTVEPGAALTSQMGGIVINKDSGALTLDGLFTCNGYVGGAGEVHTWFENAGTVNGSGQIVIPRVIVPYDGAMFDETLDHRLASAQCAASYVVGTDVTVFVSAYDCGELTALAGTEGVQGVYMTCEGEEAADYSVTGDVDLTGKKLMLDGKVNLVPAAGATLTVGAMGDISYNGRWTKINIPAGGGTLRVGGVYLISGDADAGAVFTVTAGQMFTGGAAWQQHYPITDNDDKWYYIPDGGVVDAQGDLTAEGRDLDLPLIVDGVLNITGKFKASYVEARGEFNDPKGLADIKDLNIPGDAEIYGVSVETEGGEEVCKVTVCSAVADATVFAARYKADGQFLSVETKALAQDEETAFSVKVDGAACLRFFVLSKAGIPLCPAVTVEK